MRKLTGQEKETFENLIQSELQPNPTLGIYSSVQIEVLQAGFVAGLDYQQAKFAALFQQLKGLLEMGASINDASVEELVKELENGTTN